MVLLCKHLRRQMKLESPRSFPPGLLTYSLEGYSFTQCFNWFQKVNFFWKGVDFDIIFLRSSTMHVNRFTRQIIRYFKHTSETTEMQQMPAYPPPHRSKPWRGLFGRFVICHLAQAAGIRLGWAAGDILPGIWRLAVKQL